MHRKIRCLISSFDRFGQLEANITEPVVDALPEIICSNSAGLEIQVQKLTLRSCCFESWSQLVRVLRSKPAPELVVLTGLAEKRDEICLERFALNIRDYRIADNSGHRWEGEPIEPGGPEAVRTKIPLALIRDRLTTCGIACAISNFAGSFVCNEAYYRTLRHLDGSATKNAALFVHLPTAASYALAAWRQGLADERAGVPPGEPEQTVAVFVRALTEIVAVSCQWLVAPGVITRQEPS